MPKAIKDYVFVGIQLMLFLLYAFPIESWYFSVPDALRYVGVAAALLGGVMVILAIIQLRPSLSIFPSPKTGGVLITTGVYAKFRHPIYTGLIVAMLGHGVNSESGFKLVTVVALFVLFWLKARYEESRLTQVFAEYEQYKKTSWMFFPGL